MKNANRKMLIIAALVFTSVLSCKKEQKDITGAQKSLTMEDEIAKLSNEERVLMPKLVAWYTFDGANPLEDKSRFGNDITFSNATRATGFQGLPETAYKFDGVNSFMRVTHSPSISPENGISLMAFVNVDGFYTGPCHTSRILCKGNSDNGPGRYLLAFDDLAVSECNDAVRPRFQRFQGNYGNAQFGTLAGARDPNTQIFDNRWYLLTYTFDGTTSKLYINNRLVNQNTVPGVFNSNSDDLFIGRLNSTSFPYFFNGIIDEIRIYKKAISQDEVRAVYNTITSNGTMNK